MTRTPDLLADIRDSAQSLRSPIDLDALVERARTMRFTAIGEASHGTHEFYEWRAELTRRLVQECGYTWIAVEGDWPDCWRLDRWVRGLESQQADAHTILRTFERWPTWMWANADVADFLDWLREFNRTRTSDHRVGFYGLDVYSLWDSLHRVMVWLAANAPDALPAADRAWRCFAPFDEDPQRYAWSTRLVPESCERDVIDLLVQVRRAAGSRLASDLDATQNAAIVVGAEKYYRAMVRSDRTSWNVRDLHMADTVDRIATHHGSRSKGIVWAHNTHIGDARATSMANEGMLNLGQLLRERHGADNVLLIGFASHRGTVLAADRWGAAEAELPIPIARPGSHEDLMHRALGADSILDFHNDGSPDWLQAQLGHRAIGVVYDPRHEAGNYVPTEMGRRYDALIWIEHSSALVPLRPEPKPAESEYETEPTGF